MKKRGFTLIELMIALAAFSIFAGFMYNAFFTQIKESRSFNNRMDFKYNGDKALTALTYEIRNNLGSNISLGVTIGTGSTSNAARSTNNAKLINTYNGANTVLVDLTGSCTGQDLNLSSVGTNCYSLVDSTGAVIATGITSISIQTQGNLVLISIGLTSGNDQYTVNSAVNIKY